MINVTNFSAGALDGSGAYVTPNPATIVLGSATSGGDLHLVAQQSVTATSLSAPGEVLATAQSGALQLGAVMAGGDISLSGASISAVSLSAQGADANGTSITATSYSQADGSNAGAAFVDIGAVAAPGNINLTAADGYASLTSANFTGPNGGAGQTLTLASTGSPHTVYLGYGQGGPGADNGAGPAGAQGGITGAGAIELTSNGGVSVDATGAVALDQVNASGLVSLTADAVSANAIYNNATDFGGTADGTINVAARTGDLNLGTLEAIYGPVSLTAPGAVNANVVVGQGIDIAAGGAADINYASTIIAIGDAGSYNQTYYTSSAPVRITGAQGDPEPGLQLWAVHPFGHEWRGHDRRPGVRRRPSQRERRQRRRRAAFRQPGWTGRQPHAGRAGAPAGAATERDQRHGHGRRRRRAARWPERRGPLPRARFLLRDCVDLAAGGPRCDGRCRRGARPDLRAGRAQRFGDGGRLGARDPHRRPECDPHHAQPGHHPARGHPHPVRQQRIRRRRPDGHLGRRADARRHFGRTQPVADRAHGEPGQPVRTALGLDPGGRHRRRLHRHGGAGGGRRRDRHRHRCAAAVPM